MAAGAGRALKADARARTVCICIQAHPCASPVPSPARPPPRPPTLCRKALAGRPLLGNVHPIAATAVPHQQVRLQEAQLRVCPPMQSRARSVSEATVTVSELGQHQPANVGRPGHSSSRVKNRTALRSTGTQHDHKHRRLHGLPQSGIGGLCNPCLLWWAWQLGRPSSRALTRLHHRAQHACIGARPHKHNRVHVPGVAVPQQDPPHLGILAAARHTSNALAARGGGAIVPLAAAGAFPL